MNNEDHRKLSRKSVELRKALDRILPMFVRIVLRCGVSWPELQVKLMRAFVDVATHEYGIKGRPTNIARTAALTGISRQTVKKIRDTKNGNPAEYGTRDIGYLSEVLASWHYESPYCGNGNGPIAIPFDAKVGPCFKKLVAIQRRDIPATTVFKELVKVGAVTEDYEMMLRVHTQDYMPPGLTVEQIKRFGEVVRDFLSTIGHNMLTDKPPTRRRETRVTQEIPKEHKGAAEMFIRERSDKLVHEVNEHLMRLKAAAEARETQECFRLGLGAYEILEKLPPTADTRDPYAHQSP